MKIGILTYHRTNNYGALLQAIATRVYLQQQGHEVYYIDYWPDYHRDSYEVVNWGKFRRTGIIGKVRFLCSVLVNSKGKRKRIKSFTPFLNEFIIPFCKSYESSEAYDVIIYGSDQIWRKQKGMGDKLNPVYFGQHKIKCKHKVAYAASMGDVNLNEVDKNDIYTWLSEFDAIGVRENNILEVIKGLNLKNSHLTIDPTLLLNASEWDNVLKPKRIVTEPYAVLYQIKESFDKKEVEAFCTSRGLRLIIIPSRYSIKIAKGDFAVVSPYDFVSLIKFADFAFVSSFHGLVFSINYGVQFYASFATASDRAETILNKIGLHQHLIKPLDHLPQEYSNINYETVKEKLEVMKKQSIAFLSKITNYD